jgi:hypothetical protein
MPSDGFLFDLVEPWDVIALSIRKTAVCRSNSGSVHFHVSWLSDFIFYPKPLFQSLHQSFFLFIHNHRTLRKWCYNRLLHDFSLHPLISPFHFHFRTYKRDLAILTEWWQQRIAWWELLNAACQIICIRKQHTNHMEDDIKSILRDKQFHLQLKLEQKEIIQNVLERKDSVAVLPTGLRKEHVLRSPPLILDKVRSYMQIISHDTLR